jgi:hypothetical protein
MDALYSNENRAGNQQVDEQDILLWSGGRWGTSRLIHEYTEIAKAVVNGTMTVEQANAATRALNRIARKIKVRS